MVLLLYFQATGFFFHVVLEPYQVHPLHHLAQLQVDHPQDLFHPFPRSLFISLLLFSSRIYNQENDGSLNYLFFNQKERCKNKLIPEDQAISHKKMNVLAHNLIA